MMVCVYVCCVAPRRAARRTQPCLQMYTETQRRAPSTERLEKQRSSSAPKHGCAHVYTERRREWGVEDKSQDRGRGSEDKNQKLHHAAYACFAASIMPPPKLGRSLEFLHHRPPPPFPLRRHGFDTHTAFDAQRPRYIKNEERRKKSALSASCGMCPQTTQQRRDNKKQRLRVCVFAVRRGMGVRRCLSSHATHTLYTYTCV